MNASFELVTEIRGTRHISSTIPIFLFQIPIERGVPVFVKILLVTDHSKTIASIIEPAHSPSNRHKKAISFLRRLFCNNGYL